jgi:molecular chaperone DnaK
MARNKIDYGIDLGTTNSAIARMENGEPVIKKSDTLKDTIPSCISFNKKQSILAGDSAANALRQDKLRAMKDFKSDTNTFIEFKRTMGTDKQYLSSNMNKSFSSEDLSAEVLKKLKSFISDEDLKSIVITVPAKFTINQKEATSRAAKLAGFKHCELLQEPIAASMAYGLDAKQKDGFWLVFDFGGGTFDAALLKVEDGIMKVIDTEGDNYLGGKNLDYAIVDEIIIPYLKDKFSINSIIEDDLKREVLRDAMKYFAEETKIQMSFNEKHNILSDLGDIPGEDDDGNEFELDITVTQSDMERVVKPIFQKAIDICKTLLERNNLKGTNLGALILVGGPTFSPILRKMLKEQISANVDTSVDPMTAVAKGAALFASTINLSDEVIEENRDRTKVQIGLGYEPTTVEMEEFVTIKVLKDKTSGTIPEKVFAEIVRSDKAWSSGKIQVNDKGEIVDVKLNGGKANAFNIFLYDEKGSIIECEPNEFTIIQGSKIGSATLPYNIGIEIKQRSTGKVVFHSIKGLERNQSMPATGTQNGLKTQKQIRPGISEDFIKIPIYEGEEGAQNSRAIYNEHIVDVIISGDDLPALLPEGSDVDLTISMASEKLTVKAYFPYLDHTTEITPEFINRGEIDANWLENEIRKAKSALRELKNSGNSNVEQITKVESDLNSLSDLLEKGRGDADRKNEVLTNLRKSLKQVDELNEATEWPKLEEELREEFERLEKANKELGNEKTTSVVNQIRQQLDQVIREKNIKVGQSLLEDIHSLYFGLTMIYQLINIVRAFNKDFDHLHWKDKGRARQLVNEGLQMIGESPSEEKLRPIVVALYDLLPDDEKPASDDSVLTL